MKLAAVFTLLSIVLEDAKTTESRVKIDCVTSQRALVIYSDETEDEELTAGLNENQKSKKLG